MRIISIQPVQKPDATYDFEVEFFIANGEQIVIVTVPAKLPFNYTRFRNFVRRETGYEYVCPEVVSARRHRKYKWKDVITHACAKARRIRLAAEAKMEEPEGSEDGDP